MGKALPAQGVRGEAWRIATKEYDAEATRRGREESGAKTLESLVYCALYLSKYL